MQRYTLRFPGARTVDGHLPGRVLGALLHVLAHGSAGALLLRAEGRSAVRDDRLPDWVERGTDFVLLNQLEGDAPGVVVGALPLGDALPERFEQGDMFSPLDPGQSALSLFAASLDEAASGAIDSDAFDDDLLRVFSNDLSKLFRRERVQQLTIQNGRPDAKLRSFDRGIVQTMKSLRDRTPRPRRVRLAGRMDVVRYSRSLFTLDLADGSHVRGVLVEARPELLKPHLGEQVVVEGHAQFRPSGRVLRIDVERISPASETDLAVFSIEPRPLSEGIDVRSLRRSQTASTGINAIFGKWPGDESDEDVDEFLSTMS